MDLEKHLFFASVFAYLEYMIYLLSNLAVGYAVVSGVILVAVVIFTIIQLRKQVKQRRDEEENKNKRSDKKI